MRSRWAAASALVLVVTLTGCTGGSYSTDTARTLQHGVLAVAQAASANDLAGAQEKLTALERLNNAAFGKGDITQARHEAVAASIAIIRADLSHLQDEAAQARLTQQLEQLRQQQQSGKGKNGKGDHGGGG